MSVFFCIVVKLGAERAKIHTHTHRDTRLADSYATKRKGNISQCITHAYVRLPGLAFSFRVFYFSIGLESDRSPHVFSSVIDVNE